MPKTMQEFYMDSTPDAGILQYGNGTCTLLSGAYSPYLYEEAACLRTLL